MRLFCLVKVFSSGKHHLNVIRIVYSFELLTASTIFSASCEGTSS